MEQPNRFADKVRVEDKAGLAQLRHLFGKFSTVPLDILF
jgi:hypothetical protein